MSNDTYLELKKRAEVGAQMRWVLQILEQRISKPKNDNNQKDKKLNEMFQLRIENGSPTSKTILIGTRRENPIRVGEVD